jgi:VanZ family protein
MSLSPSPRTLFPDPPPERRSLGWRRWLSDYAPPVLLMLVIFIASTDVGSTQHSGRVISRLFGWLGLARWVTAEQFDLVNHYVRKLGHLTEYALLAGLLQRALTSALDPARAWSERWAFRRVLGVLGLVALYAASDEFHQRFVAGRTPSIWDVLLDVVGGAAGLTIKRAWEARWRRRRSG